MSPQPTLARWMTHHPGKDRHLYARRWLRLWDKARPKRAVFCVLERFLFSSVLRTPGQWGHCYNPRLDGRCFKCHELRPKVPAS